MLRCRNLKKSRTMLIEIISTHDNPVREYTASNKAQIAESGKRRQTIMQNRVDLSGFSRQRLRAVWRIGNCW